MSEMPITEHFFAPILEANIPAGIWNAPAPMRKAVKISPTMDLSIPYQAPICPTAGERLYQFAAYMNLEENSANVAPLLDDIYPGFLCRYILDRNFSGQLFNRKVIYQQFESSLVAI